MELMHQGHSLYNLMRLGRSGMFQNLLKSLYVIGIVTDGVDVSSVLFPLGSSDSRANASSFREKIFGMHGDDRLGAYVAGAGSHLPPSSGGEDDVDLFDLENDMKEVGVGFLNISLAIFLIAMLPMWLWIGNRLVRLLIDKCTKFQKKPTLDECIQTVVVYWNDLEATSSDQRIVGWFSCDHEGDMCYVHQTGIENEVTNIVSSISVGPNGDTLVDFTEEQDRLSAPGIDAIQKRGGGRHSSSNGSGPILLRNTQKTARMIRVNSAVVSSSSSSKDVKLVTSHLNNQRGTAHETERYLRTSIALFCYAIISIIIFFAVVTAACWAMGTDIVTVTSLLGIAWTAVWFNSGLAGLFGNYLSYLSVLLTCRFTLGSLIQVENATMRSHGCVVSIEPLYTEVLTIEQRESSLVLTIKQIPNITFFTITVCSFFQGQSAPFPDATRGASAKIAQQQQQQQSGKSGGGNK